MTQPESADLICTAASVVSLTVREALHAARPLRVPVFQRRYCWRPEQQLAQFLEVQAEFEEFIGPSKHRGRIRAASTQPAAGRNPLEDPHPNREFPAHVRFKRLVGAGGQIPGDRPVDVRCPDRFLVPLNGIERQGGVFPAGEFDLVVEVEGDHPGGDGVHPIGPRGAH